MSHRVKQKDKAVQSHTKKNVEVILVYSSDSGAISGFKDMLHRTLSPTTYEDGLGAVTSGVLTTKRRWKTHLANSDVPITVMHRDEFVQEYPKVHAVFPAGFIKRGKKIEQFILSREFANCKDISSLEKLIERKLD